MVALARAEALPAAAAEACPAGTPVPATSFVSLLMASATPSAPVPDPLPAATPKPETPAGGCDPSAVTPAAAPLPLEPLPVATPVGTVGPATTPVTGATEVLVHAERLTPATPPRPKPGPKPLTRATPATSPEPEALPLLAAPAPTNAALPVLEKTASPAADATPAATTASAPEAFLRWLDVLREITPAAYQPSPTVSAPTAVSVGSPAIALPTDTAAAALPAVLPEAPTEAVPVQTTPPTATPTLLLNSAAWSAPPVGGPTVGAIPTSPTLLVMEAPDWPQQLGEQIQWHLGAGIQEARIEISPRDLGAVEVRLSIDDNGLRVHLSAAHAPTRELLQHELPRLRESLLAGGVLLADAQVGRESPGRDTARHADSGYRGSGESEIDAVEKAEGASRLWTRRRGLLDDYA